MTFQHPRRRAVFALLLSPLSLLLANAAWSAEAWSAEDRAVQRALYVQARELQSESQTQSPEYQSLLEQLDGYPLLPYLEYAGISPRITQLATAGTDHTSVDEFLTRNAGTYLGQRLEREWVLALAEQARWSDVVDHHNKANTNTELTCHALRARLETGDTSALQEVAPLWNVSVSQPNVCDPVFETWIAAGYPTPDIAWQRFEKTLKADQDSLANYIARQMPAREQQLAQLYIRVDKEPQTLNDLPDFTVPTDKPEMQAIILHGLRQLAQSDATHAMTLLTRDNFDQTLSDAERGELQRFIIMRLLTQGHINEAEIVLQTNPLLISEALGGWILRDALKQQDWARIETWLNLLPADLQTSERWRYWRARMLISKDTRESKEKARQLYVQLAELRSFYGFMAADYLERDYAMVDKPIAADPSQIAALTDMPAIVRAHELYLIGEEASARAEWQHATAGMPEQQIIASGKLADSWGWHRNGIQAMIQVSYWDDLQLRFPLAYSDIVAEAADQNDLTPHLVFAIARQESAFMQDVRSSAGAMGLMQLMPATAQQTAKGAGMQITNQDLFRPEVNVQLGSRYLSQLMEQFDDNRILAAAAYNAGPNRVKRWLEETGETPVPLDIWIETIPFGETRGYVQNVLTYSVIYGYRMGRAIELLTDDEAGGV
jgi:soluble lytic murein transglycosylase